MAYKTILVHADLSAHAGRRIRLAAALAREMGAHLLGAAVTGVSRSDCPDGYRCPPGSIVAGYLDPLYDRANQALDQFDAVAQIAGVASHERRLAGGLPAEALAALARFADLVVLSQDDPGEAALPGGSPFPESVALKSGRPVLVVPYAGRFEHAGRRILLAWDGSAAAARATGCALPLLQCASELTLVQCSRGNAGKPGNVQGAAAPLHDIAQALARHEARAAVRMVDAGADVGNALLSLASDLQCDLLVMGCYGHTRMRERLFGGVSRTVLRSMTLPVLMAH